MVKKIFKLSIILLLTLVSCSNDSAFQSFSDESSDKAAIDDAAIALNEQDYDKVISLLSSIYNSTSPDPESSRLLASAYMGKAGIDVTNLIVFSTNGDGEIFNMVSDTLNLYPKQYYSCDVQNLSVLLTSSGAQYIDSVCTSDIISYLNKAKNIFYYLLRSDGQDSNDIIQYGILSAVHFTISMGFTVANTLNITYNPDSSTWDPSKYKPGNVPTPIDREAYQQLRYGRPWRNVYDWTRLANTHNFGRGTGTESISLYQDDLININNAVKAFDLTVSETNDVRNILDGFLRDALQNPTDEITDSLIISTMTTSGIINYVNILSSTEL